MLLSARKNVRRAISQGYWTNPVGSTGSPLKNATGLEGFKGHQDSGGLVNMITFEVTNTCKPRCPNSSTRASKSSKMTSGDRVKQQECVHKRARSAYHNSDDWRRSGDRVSESRPYKRGYVHNSQSQTMRFQASGYEYPEEMEKRRVQEEEKRHHISAIGTGG